MTEIIPAILSKDYDDLKNKVALVRGVTPMVQIDICDGIFVNNLTWPFLEDGSLDFHFSNILRGEEGMPFWEDIDFELDLMVADAIENFDLYAKIGAKRVVFHIEAVGDIAEFRDFLEAFDSHDKDKLDIGIAINTTTSIDKVSSLIPFIDFVQCMGIERIGFQGQDFDERVIDQIKTIRNKYTDLPISVDGGVNLETGKLLVQAGATMLVAGSAILKQDDIIKTVEEFRKL